MVSAEFFFTQKDGYLWHPVLLGLHIVADALIALTYYSIVLILIYFWVKKRGARGNWLSLLLSTFLISCGTTYLIDIWTLWHPTYWLSELLKAITAVLSLPTTVASVILLPKALVLISPERLTAVNQTLQQATREYFKAERVLRQSEELKARNLALEAEKLAAESANQAKSKFLANMTHELRAPLNAILGFTQLLRRDSRLFTEQQEALKTITRSGEHLLALINDVLEMSKIEAGVTQLNPTDFDLSRLMESLEEMLQFKAQSKGLQFLLDLSPDIPPCVRTDENKLRQVLLNLLQNAIKFTAQGSIRLRVSTLVNEESEEESAINTATLGLAYREQAAFANPITLLPSQSKALRLLFEVEDTGVGITPEELETLFNAFVQTENGRKSPEGTGLGLAISHRLVELMGGQLTVKSQRGQGTIVAFDVPVNPVPMSPICCQLRERVVMGLAPNQPAYRILVVEDRCDNRQLLVQLLEPLGFEVREAQNGREALALWESWQPHLIFMDIWMPEMDGYEATKRIRSHLKGQTTVIIAITASAFAQERATILSTGCDDLVPKPFREAVVLEKIAQHLGVRYLYEEKFPPPAPPSEESLELLMVEMLLKEALTVMPLEWLVQLRTAALGGDGEQIVRLIEQIPKSHVALSLALADLVNNFRLDLIIDLTQASFNGK